MTANLFSANSLKLSKIEKDNLKISPRLIGNYYESKNSSVGHIYPQIELEKFLKKYNKNPSDIEQIELENLVDTFARNIEKYIIFEIAIFTDVHQIIKSNYRLYAVYKRN